MAHSVRARVGLGALVLMMGCAVGPHAGPGWGMRPPPRHYAQDSATSGCLRNPACYTTPPGEEAIIPWLVRASEGVRTGTAVLRLLEAAELKRVEGILVQCAQRASADVDAEDEVLRGRSPTQEECQQVVREEKGKKVTRAMEWGNKKHARALECARVELAKRFPDNVSVEPRYQRDPDSGKWLWLDPGKVKEWIELGLTHHLLGSLVPDIVIHASGNPNQVQNVFDFKFPCPATNRPTWGVYRPGHPNYPSTQGKMYEKALLGGKDKPKFVTPEGLTP